MTRPLTHHAAYEPPTRQWEPGRPDRGPGRPLRPAWSTTDAKRAEVNPEWMRDAACQDHPPGMFFPERGADYRPGKAVCWEECPVREECLAHALTNGEHWGIWGGYSARERRNLAAPGTRRKPINHGTQGGYQTHLRWGEPACEDCLAANRCYISMQRTQGVG